MNLAQFFAIAIAKYILCGARARSAGAYDVTVRAVETIVGSAAVRAGIRKTNSSIFNLRRVVKLQCLLD